MTRFAAFRFITAAGLGLAAIAQLPLQPPAWDGTAASPAFVSPQAPGGRGFGGVQPDRPLLAQFDKNGDDRLDAAERREARIFVEGSGGTRGGGFRGRGGFNQPSGPIAPGPRVAPGDVKTYPATTPFYDPGALRTLFLDFENGDWEQELMAFKDTDVDVPATLTVDGTAYADVGVSFRGMSSFMMVPAGQKHSLNISLDAFGGKQSIQGFRTLNLLNAHEDPTELRAVLFLQAARDYVPAARANFARVVINGESWGIYSNVEQYNKDFIDTWFNTDKGTRWKVPGSPNGRGGLEYFGEDVAEYKRVFEVKSKDDPAAWAALVNLTKVLNHTPVDRLEAALSPILDIDGTLKFLALDNVLVNNDGYWTRASDYNLYLDPGGKFHIIPHDANETFATGGGPGGGVRRGGPFGGPPPGGGDVFIGRGGPDGGPFGPGGPVGPGGPGFGGPGGQGRLGGPPTGGRRGGGPGGMMGGDASLDLFVGLDDASKPLRSKLLAVPALRAKYLRYAQDIATKWLDWNTLGPIVIQYHAMIAADVRTDTRKLDTTEAFDAGVDTLKAFAQARRTFVLAAR